MNLLEKVINQALEEKDNKLYTYIRYKNKIGEDLLDQKNLIKNYLTNRILELINQKNNELIFSFEGIDAIGKGTYSKGLNEILNLLGFKSVRINIPEYNLETGKIIADILKTKKTDEELYRDAYSFSNDFAINRAEVKFELDILNQNKDIIIFDRWTHSSTAFTVSKILLKHNINLTEDTLTEDTLLENTLLENTLLENIKAINQVAYDEVISIIKYIYNLEMNILNNYHVDKEFILHANIDDVISRINIRKQLASDTLDKDIHEYDAHESKLSLLKTTQIVYKNIIYGINKNEFISDHYSNQQYLLDTSGSKEDLEFNSNKTLIKILENLID